MPKVIPKSEMDILAAWLDRNGYPTGGTGFDPVAERALLDFAADVEINAVQTTVENKQ